MALQDVTLPRLYADGQVLFQQQLDAWRLASQNAFATINLNFTQIAKDCFLSGYSYDNDGNQNLGSSLQEQINLLSSGGTPISGTSADTFTINTDGFSSTLSTSGLTDIRTYTFPDSSGVIVTTSGTQTLTNKTITGLVANGNSTFDTNTLFVDATNDFIGIRRLTSNSITTTPLDVLSTGFPLAMFESTSAGSTGPSLYFFHNSASPAANDQISTFKFYGKDSGAGATEYAQIGVSISDTTAASEDASIFFQTKVAGSLATRGGFFGDALFVGRTSANAITPTALDVFTQNNEVAMFENNISGAGGPAILTYHNSASPAVSDFLGSYQFYGNSDSGVKRKYVSIASQILDPTNASEDSQIIFQTMAAGTIATMLTVGNTFVSTTTDFIIPTTNKLYFDGGSDTYISESSANNLRITCGGSTMVDIAPSFGVSVITGDLNVQSTAKVGYDGGGDTYTTEASANRLQTYVGGNLAIDLSSTFAKIYVGGNIQLSIDTSTSGSGSSTNIVAQASGGGADTVYRVLIGANDSGGVGYRMLRIVN